MICEQTLKRFCCEDISLIENYEQAINDDIQMWDCHHRFETDKGMSSKQLKKMGLYYNRPANELIFLKKTEHRRLHYKGKTLSAETRAKNIYCRKGQETFS